MEEKVYEDRTMRFLYGTAPGAACVAVLRLPVVSALYGAYQESRASRKKIDAFIKEYGVPSAPVGAGAYNSFNDLIIRKEERATCADPNALLSPCDGCLTARAIENGALYRIKGREYALSAFLRRPQLAEAFEGGYALIFRLRVYDYHRFCYIDGGAELAHWQIRGFLDSVNTAATGKFTLASNARSVSLLQTERFGEVAYAEVGALLVGRVVQTHAGARFEKGEEKGYFEFGGSTIVVLLKKGAATIDGDILEQSARGVETAVRYGERVGVAPC